MIYIRRETKGGRKIDSSLIKIGVKKRLRMDQKRRFSLIIGNNDGEVKETNERERLV